MDLRSFLDMSGKVYLSRASSGMSDDMETSSPSHTLKRLYQMLLDTPMKAIDPKDQTR